MPSTRALLVVSLLVIDKFTTDFGDAERPPREENASLGDTGINLFEASFLVHDGDGIV